MRLTQLDGLVAFVSVAKHRGFTRAAAELGVPSIGPAAEARDVERAIAEARPAEPPRHLAAAALDVLAIDPDGTMALDQAAFRRLAPDLQEETFASLRERGLTYVVVDAPDVATANVAQTVVATTSDTAYVRFHGRNAATWNARGDSAAKRFDYLYSEDELREWVGPLRELAAQANETYAFFNNNNQTDGVAQAPAGANLLQKLLEDDGVAVG